MEYLEDLVHGSGWLWLALVGRHLTYDFIVYSRMRINIGTKWVLKQTACVSKRFSDRLEVTADNLLLQFLF